MKYECTKCTERRHAYFFGRIWVVSSDNAVRLFSVEKNMVTEMIDVHLDNA